MKYLVSGFVALVLFGGWVKLNTETMHHEWPFVTIGNALHCSPYQYPTSPYLLAGCKVK